jgi:hypothetical protein
LIILPFIEISKLFSEITMMVVKGWKKQKENTAETTTGSPRSRQGRRTKKTSSLQIKINAGFVKIDYRSNKIVDRQ